MEETNTGEKVITAINKYGDLNCVELGEIFDIESRNAYSILTYGVEQNVLILTLPSMEENREGEERFAVKDTILPIDRIKFEKKVNESIGEMADDEYTILRQTFAESKVNGREEITNHLIEKYYFKTIQGTKTDLIHVFENGIYTLKGKGIIKRECEKILRNNSTTHHTTEIINKIARKTGIDREVFGNIPLNLICVENGVLNIDTMLLSEHDQKYNFTFKIPVNYIPKINCPKIKKFLGDVFYKEDMEAIKELCGYSLYREYFLKKAIIFVGETDTGKTTFLNLLTALIGIKNISGISLQKLAKDKFASADLYEKHLNIYDDLGFEDVNDVGVFKILTGKGYVTGENKYGDPFKFLNHAKILYGTNQIPKLKDPDNAYFGRWIIFRCDNVFDKNNPKTDKKLIKELTTKEELTGFLNYALEGLQQILKNQDFSYDKTPQEIKEIMERSGSPISAFAQDCLIPKETNWISKQEMYNLFVIYANSKDLPIMTIEKFGRNLPKYCKIVDGKKKDKRGWLNYGVEGVEPKNNNKQEVIV